MTGLDLPRVARLVTAPAAAARGARHLSRGALSNAGRSLAELQRVVAERFELAVSVEAAAAEPGDLQALTTEECWDLLTSRQVGRLAYVARAGRPDIVPVNYIVHERAVLLRSGVGPKLQAAERRDVVAFEVDEVDEATRSGWSVVVVGRAEVLRPSAQAAPAPAPWATGPRHSVMRIAPERVTGRRLHGLET